MTRYLILIQPNSDFGFRNYIETVVIASDGSLQDKHGQRFSMRQGLEIALAECGISSQHINYALSNCIGNIRTYIEIDRVQAETFIKSVDKGPKRIA